MVSTYYADGSPITQNESRPALQTTSIPQGAKLFPMAPPSLPVAPPAGTGATRSSFFERRSTSGKSFCTDKDTALPISIECLYIVHPRASPSPSYTYILWIYSLEYSFVYIPPLPLPLNPSPPYYTSLSWLSGNVETNDNVTTTTHTSTTTTSVGGIGIAIGVVTANSPIASAFVKRGRVYRSLGAKENFAFGSPPSKAPKIVHLKGYSDVTATLAAAATSVNSGINNSLTRYVVDDT